MAEDHDIYRESGLAAQVESIEAAVRRFDETTLAAAERVRDAEQGYVEGTVAHPDAVAVFDAASSEAPHAAGLVALLSNVGHVQYSIEAALPEQVNDTNIARIAAALRFIDSELNAYFADSDPGHLANACDTGLQNFHRALRRSFGYWQMGQDPARWPRVTADLDRRPERRDKLTGKLLAALQGWIPGSRAQLRGSLGAGTADEYSDIDIGWVVPDRDFTEAVDTLGAALSQCSAVLSLRTDPAFARSTGRRLVFARLHGLPLFWRVDIDIRAAAAAADDQYDAGNRDARGEAGWSAPASAIENAIAAIKAAARGQADTAENLLRGGCERIGHDPGPSAHLADEITNLADACATREPRLARTAAEIRQVTDHLFRSASPGDM
jgi:hypothetical protein